MRRRINQFYKYRSLGWLLRLTVKILAFLRLTVSLFPLRLTEVKNYFPLFLKVKS